MNKFTQQQKPKGIFETMFQGMTHPFVKDKDKEDIDNLVLEQYVPPSGILGKTQSTMHRGSKEQKEEGPGRGHTHHESKWNRLKGTATKDECGNNATSK